MTEPTPSSHTVGRYQVRSELGRGAMGVVYEVLDPVLHRLVALKTVRLGGMDKAQAQLFEDRFLFEARIAARLQHPGIVVVHDVGRDPDTGILFIALELLKGRTLQDLLNDGPLQWPDAVRLIARVAHALDHAHAQGVIHRDIKPANVMVLPSGEPKLMDFGIARIENALATISVPGEFVGTPLYASPEQALGQPLDKRSDIFSLGAVAYSALVGRSAFTSSSVPEIVRKVIHVDPPPPSTQLPGLPVALDAILSRALAKRPDARHATAGELAADLEGALLSAGPLTLTPAWPALAMRDPLVELQTLVADPTAGRASPRPSDAVPGESDTRPPAALLPGTAPARTRGRISPRRVLVGVALVLALVLTVVALRPAKPTTVSRDATVSPASQPAAPPAEKPKERAPAHPETVTIGGAGRDEEARPTPEPPAFPPDERGTGAEPPPRAVPAASATPRNPAQTDPGRLEVVFSHSLKEGTLKLFIDGEQVLSEEVSQKVKKLLGVTIKKGELRQSVDALPGVRLLRVQVEAEGKTRTKETRGTFFPGKTRRLEVNLGKDLDLRWK